MATTRRSSRREACVEQTGLRERYVHVYPLFGRDHVVDGYPIKRCWCEPSLEMLEDGTILKHNVGH